MGGTQEGRQPPPGGLRGLAARPCGSSLASCVSVSVCPCLCENHEEKQNRQDLGWTQCSSLFWAVAGNSTGLEVRQGCGLRTGLGSVFVKLALVIVCHSPGTRCLLYLPTGPNRGRRYSGLFLPVMRRRRRRPPGRSGPTSAINRKRGQLPEPQWPYLDTGLSRARPLGRPERG